MSIVLDGTLGVSLVQDGTITESKIGTGAVTDTKLTLTANSQEVKDALNASGSAPIYACRAWVNFNGTGTVAIRASGNVTSITDRGTGLYTINLTTAIADANYTVCGINPTQSGTNGGHLCLDGFVAQTASAIAISTITNNANTDQAYMEVAIFR